MTYPPNYGPPRQQHHPYGPPQGWQSTPMPLAAPRQPAPTGALTTALLITALPCLIAFILPALTGVATYELVEMLFGSNFKFAPRMMGLGAIATLAAGVSLLSHGIQRLATGKRRPAMVWANIVVSALALLGAVIGFSWVGQEGGMDFVGIGYWLMLVGAIAAFCVSMWSLLESE